MVIIMIAGGIFARGCIHTMTAVLSNMTATLQLMGSQKHAILRKVHLINMTRVEDEDIETRSLKF